MRNEYKMLMELRKRYSNFNLDTAEQLHEESSADPLENGIAGLNTLAMVAMECHSKAEIEFFLTTFFNGALFGLCLANSPELQKVLADSVATIDKVKQQLKENKDKKIKDDPSVN